MPVKRDVYNTASTGAYPVDERPDPDIRRDLTRARKLMDVPDFVGIIDGVPTWRIRV